MASASDAVWALDLGHSALKAMHLAVSGDAVEVLAFDTITHAKNLAEVSGAEKEEVIALSFRQFAERNYVGKDPVVVSVPTQSSFARFVTLPPVEAKKVPEIIQFEAAQQIPFDIGEVVWDSQVMTEEGEAERRVGLFAIKNEVVNAELARFDREDLSVTTVQMTSMALYNYLQFDHPEWVSSDSRVTVVLNIGAEVTDLVVCSRTSVWQRSIAIGGNTFTRAIAKTFKIDFAKAEKLKRTAAASKYARQIFQAMRPVFTDLASEVQKSLGYYTGSNANAKIVRIVATGGGTRLRGVLKFLQQSLQIPVERPDQFKRLRLDPEISAAKFHESLAELAVVYGLGVQGVGLARIESNLLPKSVARQIAWAKKFKIFVLAASLLLLVSLLALGRALLDKRSYDSRADIRRDNANLIRRAEQAVAQLEEEQKRSAEFEQKIQEAFALFKYRDVVPRVIQTIMKTLPSPANAQDDRHRALLEAFASGDVEAVKQVPRPQRRQLFVTGLKVFFSEDLDTAQFDAPVVSAAVESSEGGGMALETMMLYGRGGPMPTATTAAAETNACFVVTLEGYSPYARIGDLLDPIGVENAPEKWGVVTRLQHLDDIVDGNSPFVLFDKSDKAHFSLETGPVTVNTSPTGGGLTQTGQMPAGIGLRRQVDAAAGVMGAYELIDPFTQEVISTPVAPATAPGRRARTEPAQRAGGGDQWFRLKFKLLWRNAPKSETDQSSASSGYGSSLYGY